MKKTNKVKMGPLGTPLGNPLGYFNSLKGKKTEPKQTLRKAQDGIETNGYGEDTNMMIDKPGYSGGYRSTRPLEGRAGIFTPPPFPNASNVNAANAMRLSQEGTRSPKTATLDSNKNAIQKIYNDALINRRESNTPMMDKMYPNMYGQPPGSNTTPGQMYMPPPQSKGGSINRMKKGGSHKMPNGKMMLNSAMKKGGLVKKKK